MKRETKKKIFFFERNRLITGTNQENIFIGRSFFYIYYINLCIHIPISATSRLRWVGGRSCLVFIVQCVLLKFTHGAVLICTEMSLPFRDMHAAAVVVLAFIAKRNGDLRRGWVRWKPWSGDRRSCASSCIWGENIQTAFSPLHNCCFQCHIYKS